MSAFTSLPDFHKGILTVLKTTFAKSKFKETNYKDYEAFNQSNFKNELKQILNSS